MSDVPRPSAPVAVRLGVRFEQRAPTPSLRGLSAALFDFNLVYELGVILSDPAYSNYTFSPMRFWRRDGRPLRQEHLARVLAVRHESPMDLLIGIPAAVAATGGGLWAFWQMLERILDRPLNREILTSKMQRAVAEARKATADAQNAEVRLRQAIEAAQVTARSPARELSAGDLETRLIARVRRGELVPAELELEGERLDD